MRYLIGILILGCLAPTAVHAGTAFFVNFPVQAPVGATGQDAQAATAAGVTIVRHQISAQPAYQMAGPDGPGVGRIYSRPSQGSYVLTDVGSQWTTPVSQGNALLAVVETYASQFGWQGKAFAGASSGVLAKADLASSRSILPVALMSEIPAPLLSSADEQFINLSLPALVDASGLASGLVLWRRSQAGSWAKQADLPLSPAEQIYADTQVDPQGLYHYGLSVRYDWPGGGQAGALPNEAGSYVTLARSESSLIQASKNQPTPTPFPTLPVAETTPDLGTESWLAYPNPNRDGKVRLAFRMVKKGSYEAKFFSLDGTLVRTHQGKAEAGTWPMPVADLTSMASGIYLVQLNLRYEGEGTSHLPIRKLALVR